MRGILKTKIYSSEIYILTNSSNFNTLFHKNKVPKFQQYEKEYQEVNVEKHFYLLGFLLRTKVIVIVNL